MEAMCTSPCTRYTATVYLWIIPVLAFNWYDGSYMLSHTAN